MNMNEKKIHVALSSDNNYAEFVAIIITSIFERNKKFTQIVIHLLSNNIDPVTIDLINKHIPEKVGEMCVYDLSNIKDKLINSVYVPQNASITAYSRLFLSSILDNSIERVLYMDVDALVVGDLFSLWNIEMHDSLIAGVLDRVSNLDKESIKIPYDEPYINTGFLLINLDLWRKENIEQQFIDYLLFLHGRPAYQDQGLINAVCKGRKLLLPPEYNLTTSLYTLPFERMNIITPFYKEEEILKAKSNPVFIHFTQGAINRPWVKGSKHPLVDLYLSVRNRTEWRNKPLRPDERTFLVKVLSFIYLHFPISFYFFILKIRTIIKE